MKIGIIGLGSIGRRHAANLYALGHEVIGYDPERSAADGLPIRWCERHELFPAVDAIVIASPTAEHRQDLIDTAGLGKPVFLEKPVHSSVAHIREEYPHVIMVGYNLRFHAVVKKAREWLPRIGTPLWAHFCCAQKNEKPIYRRDGVTLNWSHEIDLALHLLGGGRCDSASINETDSMSDLNIVHTNSCRTHIHLDYLTDPEQRFFKIVGDIGTLAGNLAPLRYVVCDGDYYSAVDSYDENYVEEMRAFIDRIIGRETIGATIEDGMAVLDICMDAKHG